MTGDIGGVNAKVGDVLKIRQFGTTDPAADQSFDVILKPGQTYALYLEPFWFEPGKATGQFVIVGDHSFAYSATTKSGRALRSPAGVVPGPTVPASVTDADLRRTVTVLGTRANVLGTSPAAMP